MNVILLQPEGGKDIYMTREEYMNKLEEGLAAYDKEFANDILEDYRNHFDEAIADGRSEQAVIDELGPVEELLRDIPEEFKAENAGGENSNNSGSADNSNYANSTNNTNSTSDSTQKIIDDAMNIAGSIFNGLGKLVTSISKEVGNFVVDETEKAKKAYDDYVENNINDDYTDSTFVGSYYGVNNFKIGVTSAMVELKQGASDELVVELSRPLTKKEKMLYDIQVSEVGDSLKISTCSNPGRYTIGLLSGRQEPLTFYVSLPAHISKVEVSTVSGNVNFVSSVAAEKIKVETVSGKIDTEDYVIAQKIKLSSVSGKVAGTIDGRDIEFGSVSGKIDIKLANICKGKAETVSGNINVSLINDVGMKIECSSLSGSLKVHTDKDVRWNREGNEVNMGIGTERKAAFGNEGVVLRTETVSGTINIYDCGFCE